MTGRPLLFKTPAELECKIEGYFAYCEQGQQVERLTKRGDVVTYTEKRLPTLEGLALYLDCETRTIRNYEKRDEFFPVISRARQRIFDEWLSGASTDRYNAKIIALALSANYKAYNVQREVNHRSSTVEEIIKRLGSQGHQQIEHNEQDVIEGETVSGNEDE
jgi:hypothetical protein